jgi:hypothetical protein
VVGLPEAWSVPVVRADFSDDRAWARIVQDVSTSTVEGFGADVEFVEVPELDGRDEAAIVAGYPRAYPAGYRHPVLFVVDAVAILRRAHPLLVVNLHADVDLGPFRTLPEQVYAIQNNLTLANMDYRDFARAVGPDGVFRGF